LTKNASECQHIAHKKKAAPVQQKHGCQNDTRHNPAKKTTK